MPHCTPPYATVRNARCGPLCSPAKKPVSSAPSLTGALSKTLGRRTLVAASAQVSNQSDALLASAQRCATTIARRCLALRMTHVHPGYSRRRWPLPSRLPLHAHAPRNVTQSLLRDVARVF
uniref:Uncharacterized protein n=1 Tax=Ralstonia solanacearum TaxID=305 RepID=A0A0S4VYE2_RALSL|nr:protein of unknown function [Ralstonia solanacearum]CUV35200.1 protein of unknown function [Ralstonia solanacearum]CUV39575.1 protein of unknown function [Ralstonia solanacearum]CUV61410.1 protein of unknown function [Ralstonia solanacearum]